MINPVTRHTTDLSHERAIEKEIGKKFISNFVLNEGQYLLESLQTIYTDVEVREAYDGQGKLRPEQGAYYGISKVIKFDEKGMCDGNNSGIQNA